MDEKTPRQESKNYAFGIGSIFVQDGRLPRNKPESHQSSLYGPQQCNKERELLLPATSCQSSPDRSPHGNVAQGHRSEIFYERSYSDFLQGLSKTDKATYEIWSMVLSNRELAASFRQKVWLGAYKNRLRCCAGHNPLDSCPCLLRLKERQSAPSFNDLTEFAKKLLSEEGIFIKTE